MHRDQRYWGRSSPPNGYELGGGYWNGGGYEDQFAGGGGGGGGVEFQASETCPKNFVIFDQTYNRSTVMFHPSLAQRFGGGSSSYDPYAGAGAGVGCAQLDDAAVRQKEDTEEIDALLSSEEGEEDDVVSTGRTPGSGGREVSSPDSCSSSSSSAAAAAAKGKKKERMKKMVRTLKGIIPGGDGMDTPAVLDEAVRYLKSLKMEVKKLGARGGGGGSRG